MTKNKSFLNVLAGSGIGLLFKTPVKRIQDFSKKEKNTDPILDTRPDTYFAQGVDTTDTSDKSEHSLKGFTSVVQNFQKALFAYKSELDKKKTTEEFTLPSSSQTTDSFSILKEQNKESYKKENILRSNSLIKEHGSESNQKETLLKENHWKEILKTKDSENSFFRQETSFNRLLGNKENKILTLSSIAKTGNFVYDTTINQHLSGLSEVSQSNSGSSLFGGKEDGPTSFNNYKLEHRLQATSMKEGLTNSALLKLTIENTHRKPQKENNYTITQNFGDIVLQPATMELSMQQMKFKIEDVLRQVRDSLY